MPINRLYHTWLKRLKQLQPKQHSRRLQNFAWLIAGIYMAQSVHLSAVARKLPGKPKLTSNVQKFRRLLLNPAIHVRTWYRPVAEMLIQRQFQAGTIRLIVDATKLGRRHQLLMVALAYRRRALPIAWTWIRSDRGHSTTKKQLALLRYVHGLIPEGVSVSLVGDNGFGAIALLRQLDEWKWNYVLRQKKTHWVSPKRIARYQFGDLVQEPGESHWYPQGELTLEHAYVTNLVAHWERGEEEPWLLATNHNTSWLALQSYRRRVWVEEMFGDLKGHGVDLESTRLCHFDRLSRLTLAACLLYVWLVAFGSQIIKRGERPLVDRTDRRDLSIFRIGFYSQERRLANQSAFRIQLTPYF